jgi:aminopeptidase N
VSVTSPVSTEIHLKDYLPPSHLLDHTDLTVELLAEDRVQVTSRLAVRPNPAAKPSVTLTLQGAPEVAPEGAETPTMELLSLTVNGRTLSGNEYRREGEELTLLNLPQEPFTLECITRINPQANRSLNGLYTSGGKFVTQCESQGFRNITFYLDRPDVLSRFTTTLIAEAGKYAQLLSNGNPGQRQLVGDGRESIRWEDPFPKPCYLFALVAGNLEALRDEFITASGRRVELVIYTDKGDIEKVRHAMESLKLSMAWDEKRFGREYDLDLFQIVAVHDFNFGAMENKGLNIFNSQAVLADPQTATDVRYEYIQAVVAHEYFHNWSGNRVTCRDWFQLSLKEGFTVFRDAEFTADLNSRPVKRIDDVSEMRLRQFPEDASAMAHPIRPASVGSIENFYTPTVYEKGSEVIRMMHTLLGEKAFRTGCDLYFERHDGQAVTTEDFVAALEEGAKACGQPVDLSQFQRSWYNQAGTPTLTVSDNYDAASETYQLTVRQFTPPTPGQPVKQPFHIPLRLGLLDSEGRDIPLQLPPSQTHLLTQGDVLNITKEEETFIFTGISQKPLPSLLRNWSAPVKLEYPYTREQLAFLMAHDNDGFNRWEAGQQLAVQVLKEAVSALQHGRDVVADEGFITAFRAVLTDTSLDRALAARSLSLPDAAYLAELYPDGQVDPDALHGAVEGVRAILGKALEAEWLACYQASRNSETRPYRWNVQDAGERSIKHAALSYLVTAAPERYLPLAVAQFDLQHNMTDTRSALRLILDYGDESQCQRALEAFYQAHRNNPLALTQWFTDQATADREEILERVKGLMAHPAYQAKNPNNIRALIGGFAANMVHFHRKDGSGYGFLAEQIITIDRFNPMAAAGLTKRLSTPHRFDAQRQAAMKAQLERILTEATSQNVREIAGKSLALLKKH